MTTSDWVIVAATFIGPVVAVVITLWYQHYSAKKQDRMSLFSVMMRYRSSPLNTEFVGSLNMVPVHFHDKKSVLEKYGVLMATFEDTGWMDETKVGRLVEKANTDTAYLLSEMSKVVGAPVDQLRILRGAYSPKGWQDDADRQRRMQDQLLKLLDGKGALNVLAFLPNPTTPPEPVKPGDTNVVPLQGTPDSR